MKITLIYGQNHKGSTYHVARRLAEKLGGERKEFFLPRDFGEFCLGCTGCFMKGEENCPHYKKLLPITRAMDEADVIILASPVYVYHATGQMKAFLDHYGCRWMVHRPEEKMFTKQAVCISTAAGAGMKSTNKDMADSMFFWGVPKIYKYGVAVQATEWKGVKKGIRARIERDTDGLAEKIRRGDGKVQPGFKTKAFFLHFIFSKRKGLMNLIVLIGRKRDGRGEKRPWK